MPVPVDVDVSVNLREVSSRVGFIACCMTLCMGTANGCVLLDCVLWLWLAACCLFPLCLWVMLLWDD